MPWIGLVSLFGNVKYVLANFNVEESKQIIPRGSNYLLVIALNRFKNCRPLFYTVKDAQELTKSLITSFDFPERNVIRLFNERATHVAIWKALEELSRKMNEQDNLFIYYAGYSYLKEKTRESCLMGYDSNLQGPFGLIYHDALIERINNLPANHIFFVANTGFSNRLIHRDPQIIHAEWEEIEPSNLPQVQPKICTRWGIASMPLEESSDQLVGDSSPFARSIIKYLEAHKGHSVTAIELYQHIGQIPTYDTCRPIAGYLGDFPSGEGIFSFIPLSQSTRQNLPPKEETQGEEWDLNEAKRMDTVEGYLDFIWKYPDSVYVDFAQSRIQKLQNNNSFGENILNFVADNVLSLSIALLVIAGVFGGVFFLGGFSSSANRSLSVDEVELVADAPLEEVLQQIEGSLLPLEGGIFQTSSGEVRGISNFQIGQREVTQAQWKAITGSLPLEVSECATCPVENVSWTEVQTFIQRLNELTGEGYRLPTQSEWEFAATAGGQLDNELLQQNLDSLAWHQSNTEGKAIPVGRKAQNAMGISDMFGNVWEWCFDRNLADGSGSTTNPCGDITGTHRISRGGAWDTPSEQYSIAISQNHPESHRQKGLGFRLAKGGIPPCEEEMKSAFHYPSIQMIPVEGGTFQMGPDQLGQSVSVEVASFEMAKFELSQEQWEAIMDENPSWNYICSKCPVETVNWDQVQEFITTLNTKRNSSYRLPTEAEWEYAARGGALQENTRFSGVNELESLYQYGNCFIGDNATANTGSYPIDDHTATAPVGSYKPNALGLHDMSGNVWELCADWLGPYPTTPQNDPQGPENGSSKVIRGGGWNGNPEECGVSNRNSIPVEDPGQRWIGFRLVRDLE